MKKDNTKYFSLFKSFKDYIVSEKLISLGNSFELPALFKTLGWRLIVASFGPGVKLVNRCRQLNNFGRYVLRMVKHHGAATTVAYLKACQLATQKSIAKTRVTSLREIQPDLPLPRLTSAGLPRIIPLMDRRAISQGSELVIRWWLTVFSVYRVISIPGKLKLDTITDGYSGSLEGLERVSSKLKVLTLSFRKDFSKLSLPEAVPLLLETSSPSCYASWAGLFVDHVSLSRADLLGPIRRFATLFSPVGRPSKLQILESLVNDAIGRLPVLKETGRPDYSRILAPLKGSAGIGDIGSLKTKDEAAGKIRVFAMVDWWTQSALKPLHLFLFNYLKRIPNDGTFDQHAAVMQCIDKVKVSGCSFGYDLSAATDRLPIYLQSAIISIMFNKDFAADWERLLVGRDYQLKHEGMDLKLRYSVGQPMGAYSSWAMLAITHHYLVQLAAQEAGQSRPGSWWEGYVLLGDDIIIFNELVAARYLLIMEEIGVPINLSKSVVARTLVTEFAKVTTLHGRNVSAISWKMYISQASMMGRVNIAWSLLNKGIIHNRYIAYLRGILARNKGTIGEITFSYVALFTMFTSSKKLSYEDLVKVLINKKDPSRSTYKSLLLGINTTYIENVLAKLCRNEKPRFDKSFMTKVIYQMDEHFLITALAEPIKKFFKHFDQETLETYVFDGIQLNSQISSLAESMIFNMLQPSASDIASGVFVNDPAYANRFKNPIEGTFEHAVAEIIDFYAFFLSRDECRELRDFTVVESFMMHGDERVSPSLSPTQIRKKYPNASFTDFSFIDKWETIVKIEDWMALQGLLDRYAELLRLVERAKAKAEKTAPSNVKQDSPLKALTFIRNSRKGRPLWSYYDAELYKNLIRFPAGEPRKV